MLEKLKRKIMKKKKYYKIYQILKLIKNSLIFNEKGKKKKYPEVLQFPITNNCNSRCIMCNIPNMKKNIKNEIDCKTIKKILNDNIFSKVKYIGINGGEPFLKNDLLEIVEIVSSLPNIKGISIITNGFLTEIILKKLEKIKKICNSKNIKVDVTISLDGYKEIHDRVRGVPNCFNNTIETIEKIKGSQEKYCNSFITSCTITRENIYYVEQLKVYCKLNKIPIKFRIGIKNKRIESQEKYEEFSIFEDLKLKQTASEIFYTLYSEEQDIFVKFKYWAIYNFLTAKKPKRKLGCAWKENGITLDCHGNLYYCAVESEKLIEDNDNKESIFFSEKNIEHRKNIIKNKCKNCIHDYEGRPLLIDVFKFIYYYFKEDNEWGKCYKK